MIRRPDTLRTPARALLPLFRVGAAARLVTALGLSGLLWIAILWAAGA